MTKLKLGQVVQILEPNEQKIYVMGQVTEVIDDIVLLYRVLPVNSATSVYVDEREIVSVLN